MATVHLRNVPPEITIVAVENSGTDPVLLTAATPGKVGCLWWFQTANGTSMVIKSNTTALGAAITTTGLATAKPNVSVASGAPAKGYPDFESVVGEALYVDPEASGLDGNFYVSLEDPM